MIVIIPQYSNVLMSFQAHTWNQKLLVSKYLEKRYKIYYLISFAASDNFSKNTKTLKTCSANITMSNLNEEEVLAFEFN